MAFEAGKGSRPRPYSVSQQEYDSRWDAIFGRDNTDTNQTTEKKETTDGKEAESRSSN